MRLADTDLTPDEKNLVVNMAGNRASALVFKDTPPTVLRNVEFNA